MRTQWVQRAVVGICIVIGLVAGLWLLLGPLAEWVTGPNLRGLDPKDQLAAVSSTRGQLLAVVTGAAVLGGLVYTVRNYRLAKEGQVTDRFSKAVGHLDSDDETVRAGGIRALDRIMADSPRDHDRILESVTGFLRNHAQTTGENRRKLPDDINAALTTLRLRPQRKERGPIDLAGMQVPGANLGSAAMLGADLTGADLGQADLRGVDLSLVLGLTTQQLALARTDTNTRVPVGVDHPAAPPTAG